MDKSTEISVIIALLPQDDSWCKIESAHLTLVYVGETDKLKASVFNTLAKEASSIGMLCNTLMVKVLGLDVFGEEERVDVLKLSPTPELLSIRNILDSWDNSQFPFNPHCTIGPQGTFLENMPLYLIFDRISVFWGKDRLTFWLRKY